MKKATNGGKKNGKKKQELNHYNEFKDFEGQKYTGMKVGGHHKWIYESGEWKETKVSPDLWEFNYRVTKRRKGRAPEGSGVPLGTEYHWYILAHQNVRKLDANTYSTAMRGFKYKLAHKRADKESWSTSYAGQRKRLIKLFRSILTQLEQEELDEKLKARKKRTVSKKV